MSADRRQLNRHQLTLPVRFEGNEGVTRDVSADGFYFETSTSVPEGVVMQFAIEFSRPFSFVRCEGRVLRVDSDGHRNGVAVQIESFVFEPAG